MIDLTFYIIVVFIIAIIALFVWIIPILTYKWDINEKCASISFDQFLAFYKSAPHKWKLRDEYLQYSVSGGQCFLPAENIYLKSYSDYRKYRKWYRDEQKKGSVIKQRISDY